MKLSDIKGERSLDIIADAMELVEIMSDDERFQDLVQEIREGDGDKALAWRALCRKMPPILRDDQYRSRMMSILASAAGVPLDQYVEDGEVLKDIFELLTSDVEALGFFVSSAAMQG